MPKLPKNIEEKITKTLQDLNFKKVKFTNGILRTCPKSKN